jgi:hypothetical protein
MTLEEISTSFDAVNLKWRHCVTQAQLSEEIDELENLLEKLDKVHNRRTHVLWSKMNYTQGLMRLQLNKHKEHVHIA